MPSEEYKRFMENGGFHPPQPQTKEEYTLIREAMEAMVVNAYQPPDNIAYRQVSIGGVAGEWMVPPGAPEDRAVLYFHGGGFTLGSVATHRHLTAAIAGQAGVRLLSLDYRLAPENPYPAAAEDCLAAYRALLAQGLPAKGIVLAGDSAGGNLALTTVLRLKDAGGELPAAVAAIAPVTDFMATGASYQTMADNPLASILDSIAGDYIPGEKDLENPYISPLYGDYRGYPPLFLQVGTGDVLLDDSVMLAARAGAAGADVTLKVWEEMCHVFANNIGRYPEADAGIKEIASYIKSHLIA